MILRSHILLTKSENRLAKRYSIIHNYSQIVNSLRKIGLLRKKTTEYSGKSSEISC